MNGDEFEAAFTNQLGTVTTAPATLTVQSAPIIAATPANTTVNTGATATFSASANSNPGATGVQWEYNGGTGWFDINNGGSLPGGAAVTINTTTLPSTNPTSTISIANTSYLLNGYEFEAAFTNSIGTASTINTPAVLSVDYAPIVTAPSSQTVNAGATDVTFSAGVNADPTATVQWYVSTNGGSVFNSIAAGGMYSAVTSDTLTIIGPVTAAMNGYEYEATFTNSLGSATTSSARLTVGSAPVIGIQPVNESQPAGGTAIFTAAATASPAITGIQWEYSTGGTFTDLSNGTFEGATISGSGTGTLTISGLTTALSGDEFEAVFTNTVGSTSTASASLNVETAPAIQSNPTNDSVTVGSSASFAASATGNPTPTVQWEVSTDGGSSYSPISAGGVYGNSVTANTLTISSTAQSMNGYMYEAVFGNGATASTTSTAATLTVGTAPAVTSNPTSSLINIGGTTSFTATASGVPTPTVEWEVNEGSGFTVISNNSVYNGATTNTLTLSHVTAAMNSYQYEAVFTNAINTVTTTPATLSVLGLVLTEGPNVLLYDTSNKLIDTIQPFGSNVSSVQAAVGYLSGGVNSDLVVAAGTGGGQILVYNGLTGSVETTISPFGASYGAGVHFAIGNVLTSSASNLDIVVAPGGAGKGVAVYNSAGTYVTGFLPYTNAFPNKSYTGGLNVAVGNLKGSGPETIVIGTNAPQKAYAQLWNYSAGGFVKQTTYTYSGEGAYVSTYQPAAGGPAYLVVGTDVVTGSASAQLEVQNPANGSIIAELPTNGLNVFDFGNTGPVRVGVMDVNGDGIPDIVAATGSGTTQEVRVFDLSNTDVLQLLEPTPTLSATALDLTAGYNGGLYVG